MRWYAVQGILVSMPHMMFLIAYVFYFQTRQVRKYKQYTDPTGTWFIREDPGDQGAAPPYFFW